LLEVRGVAAGLAGDAGDVHVVAKIGGRDGDELSTGSEACCVHVGKEPLAVLGSASGHDGGQGQEAKGVGRFPKCYRERGDHGFS
jgi:hypothetical protein